MYEDVDERSEAAAENARKEIRWNIPVAVLVRGTLPDGKTFEEEGVTEDVSPSGMSVFLPAPLKKGSQIQISERAEGFESPAVVTAAQAMGPNMHRVRVRFEGSASYDRRNSSRRFIYDVSASKWVGYLEGGTYYNHKHEPFGKLENDRVVSLDSAKTMLVQKRDSFYDLLGNYVGRLI